MTSRKYIGTRLFIVLAILSVAPLLVALKVAHLTIVDGKELRSTGLSQALGQKDIPALRGSIMDRSGRWLVVNTNRYELAVDPTAAGFSERAESLYQKLARGTGRSAASYRRAVRNRSSRQYAKLHRSISEPVKQSIDELDIPGVILKQYVNRHYNYGHLASHVLGHVNVDLQGISGLEQQYDDVLRGQKGTRYVLRDRKGVVKPMTAAQEMAPEHGQHLKLTLDLVQQSMAEQELAKGAEETGAEWGTVVAMNPHTGQILALANYPDYNPNAPASYSDAQQRNHAITDRIEPGSTFKLVTAIAALEEGGVTMDQVFETGPGVASVSGRLMYDTHAHNDIPFFDVIRLSSNIGAALAGLEVDPDEFYRTAQDLGFGENTWIDLPGEVGGRVGKPSTWSRLSQAWMSHGYEVEVTPLQLLAAYAALANGGLLVQPYVVEERHDMYGNVVWRARQDSIRRAFKRRTADELRPAFVAVVDSGTATRAQVEGLKVAGKTGTAKKAPYDAPLYRSSFVGFFPADDPEVVMIVVLDEPKTSGYGGISAAPIFRRIAERWIATLPSVAAQVAAKDTVRLELQRQMPDVRGLPSSLAESKLRSEGFEVKKKEVDPFALVFDQAPKAGSELEVPVSLTINDPEVPITDLMPDLVGLPSRQALAWLDARGVSVHLEGSGQVITQSPGAGDPLPSQAMLNCSGPE